MSNPNGNPNTGADKAAKELTAAEAAKRVKRSVTTTVKDEDGNEKTVTKQVAVGAAEVLSFRDYGTHLVVVTRDGQKLTSANVGAEA
jgi:hypothetical protein